jgi:parvulin-like peptidyl-prolyl isomerase
MREPLLQLLLGGLLLFAVHAWLNRGREAADADRRIEITADDLRQIEVAWLAQGRAAPTPEQLRQLVEARVREEILYREALGLGLDTDDVIVRRRLAQKMEFLFEDVAALSEPTSEELQAWFEENSERFATPARASFRHLYFSPDRRGAGARDDAEKTLARLAGQAADAPSTAALGDPFMFQDYYGDRSQDQIARDFGPRFAAALRALAAGAWTGPIESGYGWHLVRIDALTPARVPTLEEIEADVRRAWVEEQRNVIRERAFAAMRARYEVVLPEDLGPVDLASLPPADRTDGADGAR